MFCAENGRGGGGGGGGAGGTPEICDGVCATELISEGCNTTKTETVSLHSVYNICHVNQAKNITKNTMIKTVFAV